MLHRVFVLLMTQPCSIIQVDAAQGAEEMVEQLTEKTLQQEEQLQSLMEEKNDLVCATVVTKLHHCTIGTDI